MKPPFELPATSPSQPLPGKIKRALRDAMPLDPFVTMSVISQDQQLLVCALHNQCELFVIRCNNQCLELVTRIATDNFRPITGAFISKRKLCVLGAVQQSADSSSYSLSAIDVDLTDFSSTQITPSTIFTPEILSGARWSSDEIKDDNSSLPVFLALRRRNEILSTPGASQLSAASHSRDE